MSVCSIKRILKKKKRKSFTFGCIKSCDMEWVEGGCMYDHGLLCLGWCYALFIVDLNWTGSNGWEEGMDGGTREGHVWYRCFGEFLVC